MEINARVKDAYTFKNKGYINIMFYGTLSYDQEFQLEVRFNRDGSYIKDYDEVYAKWNSLELAKDAREDKKIEDIRNIPVKLQEV